MNQLGTIVNYVCIVSWTRTTSVISLSAVSAALSGWACTMAFIHFQTGGGRGGVWQEEAGCWHEVSRVLFIYMCFIYSFVCLFVFSEADLVTFFGCLCWENEVKTVDLQSRIWRRRIQSALDMWALFCLLGPSTYSNEILHFNWKYWIYGDAFRCLDKVGPTHFQVGAPVRSCSWSPVGGQGSSCFCVASCPSSLLLLLTLFSIRTWCLVSPLQPTQRHPASAWPLPPPKLFDFDSQMQPLEIKETGWRSFRCVSSIPLCLSTPEPPAEILSLNYCTQHIPVRRTHAYMRAHTAKHFSSQTSQNESLHFSQLLAHSSLAWLNRDCLSCRGKKGKATFYVSKITSLSVICSHNSFVRWRQVDFAEFHISDFSDSLICWALKNKWSSPIKKS